MTLLKLDRQGACEQSYNLIQVTHCIALAVWINEADTSPISTELWFLGALWGVRSLISTFKLSILTYCQPFINHHINNNNMMGQTKVESESSSSWSCHMFCKVDWVIFTPTDSSLSKNTFTSSSVTDRERYTFPKMFDWSKLHWWMHRGFESLTAFIVQVLKTVHVHWVIYWYSEFDRLSRSRLSG